MGDAHTSDFRGTDWFMECLSGETGMKQLHDSRNMYQKQKNGLYNTK